MTRLATLIVVGAGLLVASPAQTWAKVNVFACEPEWASLAAALGGDDVSPYAATNARQDPHHIRARPSLLAKMRKADIVLCSGGGLEIGWLPLLLQKAGNANVQPGGRYYLMAADMVPVLEKPSIVDRSMGDVHPEGNPHVHLNPHNIPLLASALNTRFQAVDAARAGNYQARYEAFSARWQEAINRWEKNIPRLKGQRIITHHKSWSYLIDWLGLELVNTLEPKPGIPPNTGHLETLLRQVQGAPILAIIRTPFAPDDASAWLSEKSGIPATVLPYTVGGNDAARDLISLFDDTMRRLIRIRDDKR